MPIPFNTELTPVTYYDKEVDQYVVFYEEFPQAITVGQTEENASNKLFDLLELMWFQTKQKLA